MDLFNIIVVLVQMVLASSLETESNNAGKDVKSLTEKACK